MRHLIFVQHGMFGTSHFFDNFKQKLESAFTDSIVILPNKNNFLKSLGGTQTCGDNLVKSVEEALAKYPDTTDISFIGHSFGGILSRYAIGVLESKNIFDKVKPLAYVSISTPHTGVVTDSKIIEVCLKYCTGETGKDLIDRTTLKTMSEPNSSYMIGLNKFKLKLLYGNLHNDTVVAQTACLCENEDLNNLIEIFPERLYAIGKQSNSDESDEFSHIKNVDWKRKVINLSDYMDSHIAIVGRHTYLPFMKIKNDEAKIVIHDIILEIALQNLKK